MNTIASLVTPTQSPDYSAIKSKQQAIWGAGNYGRIGVTLQITGEQLCETMDLRAGQTVLDVAAGNGNATLAAARRGCQVTSTDYVDALLEQCRQRAQAEFLHVDYRQADAENLPFDDQQFDNVTSTFGVMFAPNQTRAAAELIRVCRSGGRIGLANWTPGGFIGQVLKTVGSHLPPPAGVNSPATWGTEEFLRAQFATQASDLSIQTREFNFRYSSPEVWIDTFKTYYGPTVKAFEALGGQGEALREDLLRLVDAYNRAEDGTMVVASDYVEAVIVRA